MMERYDEHPPSEDPLCSVDPSHPLDLVLFTIISSVLNVDLTIGCVIPRCYDPLTCCVLVMYYFDPVETHTQLGFKLSDALLKLFTV